MPASPADSQIYGALFNDPETAQLFTDSAELRAMLLVEGALAKVQGAHGLIPQEAADYIARAVYEVQIDPSALAAETARNGVPIPALLAAFRKSGGDPTLLAYVHWGATSQDIMDSALALRLRRVMDIWDSRLTDLIRALGQMAENYADQPMLARTYGQAATVTSFGAVVASWGAPLMRHKQRLAAVRADILCLSLSGAAGTLSAMGDKGAMIRADLAQALDLRDPMESWHSQRDGITAFAGWMAGLAASLGKMAEDIILSCQTGIDEITLGGAGGSSTMPQKQNPVAASAVVALARQIAGLSATITGAAIHRQQRDGAAWFTEWLALPQICILTGRSISLGADIIAGLVPNPAKMQAALNAGQSLHHAEALTFQLAAKMPRPAAQAQVTALCTQAQREGTDLIDLAKSLWPDLSDTGSMGAAPATARAFAKRALA